MKHFFTPEQIAQCIHIVEIEEDDLLLEGVVLEGSEKNYVITGVATIEEERYRDFQIEFALLQMPSEETAEEIMSMEWDWYDYLC